MLRTSGTKLLAAALTVVLAGVCLADGYLIHGRRPAAAPPAGNDFYDDFEDNLNDWEDYDGWNGGISVVSGEFTAPAASGSAIYTAGSNTGEDGYICTTMSAVNYGGPKFRASATDSNRSYVVRNELNGALAWRHCGSYSSCTTIQSASVTLTGGEHLGITWTGTGASTVVNWYVFVYTDPSCHGCTGGACDTSGWAANADQSGSFTTDPPTGTYAELDTNRYWGLYNGSSGAVSFKEMYMGDN